MSSRTLRMVTEAVFSSIRSLPRGVFQDREVTPLRAYPLNLSTPSTLGVSQVCSGARLEDFYVVLIAHRLCHRGVRYGVTACKWGRGNLRLYVSPYAHFS